VAFFLATKTPSIHEENADKTYIYFAPLALERILLQNPGLHPGQTYFAPLGLKGQNETCFIRTILFDDWICRLVAGFLSTPQLLTLNQLIHIPG